MSSWKVNVNKFPKSCNMLTMGQANSFSHIFAASFMTTLASRWLCDRFPVATEPPVLFPTWGWPLPYLRLCAAIGYVLLRWYPRDHQLTGEEFCWWITETSLKIFKGMVKVQLVLSTSLPLKGRSRIFMHVNRVFRDKSGGPRNIVCVDLRLCPQNKEYIVTVSIALLEMV